MAENPADKRHPELTASEVDHFYKVLSHRAEKLLECDSSSGDSWTRYLFAANTGAAAGMFVLLQKNLIFWHLIAFFIFCLGTFCIGISHFAFASWTRELAKGSTDDLNAWGRGEMTVRATDENNSRRHTSWKPTIGRWTLILSFILLSLGGLIAAVPFFLR